uniref:LEM domain-containing protein n=1 Tax=Ciona savignyi TaxID=51511 RepID=H2Y9P4_CIOSA
MSQHQTAKNKGNVLINSQGNFSSDDDATSMNKSSNKRVKRKKKPVEPDTESISVHELTNDEIVAQLRSFGMNPGPVGPSTRNVYIKKLEKYMSKEQAVNNQEYSDKEEEIEVEQPTVVTRSSSRRKTAQLEIKSTRKSRTTEHTTYNSSQPVHAHADDSSATRRRPLRPRVNDQVKKTSEPIVATKV